MPELPEVQTVRKFLASVLLKPKPKKLKNIRLYYPTMIKGIEATEFVNKLIGQTFTDIDRYGKYLMLKLEDNSIISHLRMEGKYRYATEKVELTKHDHVQFIMTDGSVLIFSDVRKFGTMNLVKRGEEMDHSSISKLGPEANTEDFHSQYLLEVCGKKQKTIKQLLLEQESVCGIGNIYADEILFASGINPQKKAKSIDEEEAEKIVKQSRYILEKAILNKGTTIKSFSANEQEGDYQNSLNIYGREGQQCSQCETKIKKIKLGGRGTHFCPHCQH